MRVSCETNGKMYLLAFFGSIWNLLFLSGIFSLQSPPHPPAVCSIFARTLRIFFPAINGKMEADYMHTIIFMLSMIKKIISLWQKWLFVCNGQWWIQSERRKDKAARTIHFKRTRRGKTSRIWANGDRRAQQNFGKLTHTLEHLAQVTFRTNSSRSFAHRTCVMHPSQKIETEHISFSPKGNCPKNMTTRLHTAFSQTKQQLVLQVSKQI